MQYEIEIASRDSEIASRKHHHSEEVQQVRNDGERRYVRLTTVSITHYYLMQITTNAQSERHCERLRLSFSVGAEADHAIAMGCNEAVSSKQLMQYEIETA
ncbi:hypothetical protein EV198_0925 [Roseivirga ehrenbergii]|uniref:hypothetical protein n=1 Tax=Roseivirga ehrenbergii (strain DSM 102268 / JCM 13514 / KCTC 12282 / NCIMB 14502 / KMM 6017) TaxID=279360 RepID=UPI000AB28A04|nr:hypothetical protein [Roseivirga ehrenbergii]TCL14088.1 hypothetical protein EV198_0925 [Roseivirga ehrenbergii]